MVLPSATVREGGLSRSDQLEPVWNSQSPENDHWRNHCDRVFNVSVSV